MNIVFESDALVEYLDFYNVMRPQGEGEASTPIALGALQVDVRAHRPNGSKSAKRLRVDARADGGGDYVLAGFSPDDLFGEDGVLPNGSAVTVDVNFPYRGYGGQSGLDVVSIPYRKVIRIENDFADRVAVGRYGLDEFTPLWDVPFQSFVDVNEPFQLLIQGNIDVRKDRLRDDGSWDPMPLHATGHSLGRVVTDTGLAAGATYRYRFFRDYADPKPSGDGEIEALTRQVNVDDFGAPLFVPVSALSLSDKVLVPLVVPIANAPQLESGTFQVGPGVSFPFRYVNPRPSGSSRTGLRTLRVKVGLTLAALESTAMDEDDEVVTTRGAFAGPWVSFFDLLQFGVAWRVTNDGFNGKGMVYMGLSTIDLIELLQG